MFIFSKCYLVIFVILFAYLFFIVLLAFLIYYVLNRSLACTMYHVIYITYRFINQENIFFHERKLIINEENKLFYERKLIKSCFTNSFHH